MTARRVRQYIYTDQKGRPKLRKVRSEPKQFTMQSWNSLAECWAPGIKRQQDFADKAMYQLPELMWALRAATPVFWLEGEKDASAVTVALGSRGVGTSHWQGACNATAEQAAWFSHGVGPVFVVVDRDDAGAACGLARRRLLLDNGTNQNRVTMLAPPRPFNDAADAIAAGHKLDDFIEVSGPQLRIRARRYVKTRTEGGGRGGSDWYGSDGKFQLPDGWNR